MSSQVAIIANEPVRSLTSERPRRQESDQAVRAGESIVEFVSPITSATPDEPAEIQAPELVQAVANIQSFVTDMQRELQFNVDEDSGRTIITVIDSDSGRIIRQIPPEEVLKIAQSVANGAFNLIDSQA